MTVGISVPISRFADYYGRHGLRSTFRRTGLALKRMFLANRSVLFYCDLSTLSGAAEVLPASLNVERKTSAGELSSEELSAMTSFWNPNLAHLNLQERFESGASLWLIRYEGELAGYGWTLKGETIEPHYFPLASNDVHLFDFHVFTSYRGRNINPRLVTHVLHSLAAEKARRAFIEAAEWNSAQLSSLSKTPFCCLSRAKKLTIGHRTLVFWKNNEQGTSRRRLTPRAIQ
jgi:ribosomal protein S18 acetylase RimI-like enzyme